MVWYSDLFQNFPQFIVIHTVKGFGIVNKAEIDVFLELSCFFHDPEVVGNLTYGSSAFSKTSLNIWKFSVHILLKLSLENFQHYFANMQDECNCAVVELSLALPSFGARMTFSISVAKVAGILSVALKQHHILGFEIAQLEFNHLH